MIIIIIIFKVYQSEICQTKMMMIIINHHHHLKIHIWVKIVQQKLYDHHHPHRHHHRHLKI